MNNLCVYFWLIKACSIFFWISCWRRYDFKNELGQWMENIQSCRIWQIVFLSIFIISNTIHVQNHCIRGLIILLMEVLIMLSTIGFSGESILLLRSYLVDRLSSDHEETIFQLILSGVPHGAVLRPLISLINISQFEKFNKLNLFAYVRWWLPLYYHYSIENIQDSNVKIIRGIHVLAITANQHSKMLNPKKSKFLMFGNESGIEHSLRNLKFNIGEDYVKFRIVRGVLYWFRGMLKILLLLQEHELVLWFHKL